MACSAKMRMMLVAERERPKIVALSAHGLLSLKSDARLTCTEGQPMRAGRNREGIWFEIDLYPTAIGQGLG